MQKSFTQNHLVTLLLGDLTPAERSAQLAKVNSDWRLKEAYSELKKGHLAMPRIVLRPSQKVVDNILRYSKTSMVEA